MVLPETVGEFIGIFANEKRIFEGDKIRYANRLDYEFYLESLEHPEDYEECDYSNIWSYDIVDNELYFDYPAYDLRNNNFDINGLSELLNGDWFFEVIGNIFEDEV